MRARISKGIAKLNELGLLAGIQDLAQEAGASSAGSRPTWEEAEIRSSRPVIQTQSVIQEDSGPRWLLVGIFVVVAIILAGVAFFILSRGGL